MADLLDVNVLVALLIPEHQHHAIALEWFGSETGVRAWATCPVTELGVIRVCAQLPGGKWSPEVTADRLVMLMIASRGYEWWPGAISPSVLPEVRSAETAKHVTDRYLLGLARRNGGRVVTFDRALSTSGGSDVLCLLPNR